MSEGAGQIRVMVLIDDMGSGGAQTALIDFCGHFDRRRFVVLVCSLGKGTDMLDRLQRTGVPVKVLNFAKWNPFCLGKLRRVASEFKPDIIYCHLFKSLLVSSFLARGIGRPFVYHEHCDGTIRSMRETAGFGPLSWVLYRLQQRRVRQAARLIAPGPNTAKRLREHGFGRPECIDTVECAIVLSKFDFSNEKRAAIRRHIRSEFGIPEAAAVVVNVGRFSVGKNWAAFVDVVARVARTHPEVRGLAAGDGPLLDEIKDSCAQRGLEHSIIFTGFRKDVADLLAASDLMVFTSLHESGPIVVKEAMACGVPVVTYEVGETRSMIREGRDGYVVRTGDIDGIVERCLDLLGDPAKRAEFSRSCRERAFSEFGVEATVRRIEGVLAKAAK